MQIYYDTFIGAFLGKITEYSMLSMDRSDRTAIVTGYMKRVFADLFSVCKELTPVYDDANRKILLDASCNADAIVDIVSEGMVVQWLKPYVYRQENLENVLNTRDYTTYSPAELLRQISAAYAKAQNDYTQMVREYSFRFGDITELHL